MAPVEDRASQQMQEFKNSKKVSDCEKVWKFWIKFLKKHSGRGCAHDVQRSAHLQQKRCSDGGPEGSNADAGCGWVRNRKTCILIRKNLKFLVYMDEMAHFDRERIPERVRINSFLRKHFSVKNYKIASFIFRIFFIDGFWWPNRIFLGKENIFLWTWTLFFLVRNLMNFRLCMQKVAVLMAILRWPAAKSANTAKLRCSVRSASEPQCSSASPVLVGFCWKISISVR